MDGKLSDSERWVYAVSDAVTGLFFFLVPLPLIYFRVSFPYHMPRFYNIALVLFKAAFFLCGTSHVWMMLLQTGISSHVSLLAVLKVVTATVSVFTLAALFLVVPSGPEFVRHSAGLDQRLKHKLVELEDALAEVRRANMNKGLFISTISHELRNPLHAVMANTGFMVESRLTPDQRSLMGMIRDSVDLMTHIVNDVLDLSRLEAGRMSFERIPVNVAQRCQDVLHNLETQSKPKQVKVSFELGRSTPTFIISDPTRIDQLLINLLSNAIKFSGWGQHVTLSIAAVEQMPVGSPPKVRGRVLPRSAEDSSDATKLLAEFDEPSSLSTKTEDATAYSTEHTLLPCRSSSAMFDSSARSICIDYYHRNSTAIDELDGDSSHPNEHSSIHVDECDHPSATKVISSRDVVYIVFTVGDAGVGISSDSLVQLFTAYTQAKLSTVREHGGTGLGLCICAEIVRSMRGCVVITSQLGKGSEFSFYLPVAVAQEHEWLALMRASSPIAIPEFAATDSTTTKLVLVVDDNEVNRKILGRMLDSLGFSVQMAVDGLKAVEAFQVMPPPLFFCVFMDISMPHLDGYEASRHIRSMGFATPIVALTANVQDEDKNKSIAAGMDYFLTKPLKKRALETTLKEIVTSHFR